MKFLFLLLLLVGCASVDRPVLSPCTIEDVEGPLCGTFSVAENPDEPEGRRIDLNIVVLPAKNAAEGGGAPRSPIFVLQGGPGQAATTLADFYGRVFSESRRERDIVLIDQRGTGKSNGLQCAPPPRGSDAELDLFPHELIARCREELQSRADLRFYTSTDAVRDLEAVRRAFGYERIDLYGTSYGTRVAMAYAAKYPQRVRSMILKGVVPPRSLISVGFAENTERSLNLLFDDCEADAACRTAYPTLRQDYRAVRSRLESGPVMVTIPNEPQSVRLTAGRVAAGLRSLLQSTGSAAEVPRLIHAASFGDWAPLASIILQLRRNAASALSTGMLLSVACSEDVPFIGPATLEGARTTFLGTYWGDQLVAACTGWPRGQPLATIPRLDVPTLLVSGYLDPATPPAMAEEATAYLSKSRDLVVRNGSHSFTGLAGCVDRIMNDFVESGNPAGLDLSCADSIRRPPFKG